MKKILCAFLSLFVLCASILSLNTNVVYSNEYIRIQDLGSQKVYNYLYKDLTNIGSKVDFLFKAIVTSKQGKTKEELNNYIKDIEFLQTEIGYLSDNMKSDYKTLKLNETYSQALLFEIIIASVYDLTLFQLKEYINADTPEEEYTASTRLFKSLNHAREHLEDIKQLVPQK
jgi:hypothetical protein